MKEKKKCESRKKSRSNITSMAGITLVALVVTIIVLIILATISINAVFSENGIIAKAQFVKDIHTNAIKAEEEAMNLLLSEYENATNTDRMPAVPYEDGTLPSSPKITEGMTKVKYNNTSGKWEKVEEDSEAWYDYSSSSKEWANVVLGDATFNADGTLDESQPYTQLVWIPRFAYKITSQYHTASTEAGNIEIIFIDSNNQNKEKTITYSTTYPSATTGVTTGMDNYVVHPAFDYDGNHLTGFWMGKFESSHTGCTTDSATGNVAYTGNEVMTIKANVTSWRLISIGNAFTTCLNMNRTGNPYGLSSNDSVVDPHMVKNDEWGAVAYLSQSTYGKNSEVYINNNSNYITGIAGDTASASETTVATNTYNTTAGVNASTTGNVYGIYDMSGGNWERVAAYVNNGHDNLTTYGEALVNGATKYKNVYTSTVSDGSDSQTADYALSTSANDHYGDAVYETSGGTGTSSPAYQQSWYSDYSLFPYSSGPFFGRGGNYTHESNAGVFRFGNTTGDTNTNDGFRVVVSVL